ncbi:MAG: PDDEXK nuclease domain-containing protein [Endomicrobiales bacterium]|nr:PDDEXK nuclease domain-containing protein [Endomicrobiales bacterium]
MKIKKSETVELEKSVKPVEILPRGTEYEKFLQEIKSRVITSRTHAARLINKDLISMYWFVGKQIHDKQKLYGWGNSVVEMLSRDLQREFPGMNGFSERNVWNMRRFYIEYKHTSILQQLVAEIPWGQNLLILEKISDVKERKYYIKSCREFGWSRNVLLNQIKAGAYQLSLREKSHNYVKVLPAHLAEQAEESLKSVYNLDFLGITKPILERELERRLVEKIKQFILELGTGFSFMGNQYGLKLDGEEYFIDLLFFNRKLKCLVAVELKTGKFQPEYAGKMDFYLHLLNEQTRLNGENPSIGIILCAQKKNITVEYSLRSAKNPVGVAEYQLTNKLPAELRKVLPSEKELQDNMIEEIK